MPANIGLSADSNPFPALLRLDLRCALLQRCCKDLLKNVGIIKQGFLREEITGQTTPCPGIGRFADKQRPTVCTPDAGGLQHAFENMLTDRLAAHLL